MVNDQESQAISQMRVLFGKPPLIKGESEEDYWKFWDAFVEDVKPKRWPDWIVVNDLAHKYWEQLRLLFARSHRRRLYRGVGGFAAPVHWADKN